MARVFLSASFPSGPRGADVLPYSTDDVAAAASAVIEAVLRTGAQLVFGGHPTITPLVLQTADLMGTGAQVEMWQSDHFADVVTPESRRLVAAGGAVLRGTAPGRDRAESLLVMRRAMLTGHLSAAFFAGGMDGTLEELTVLQELQPGTPVFAFTTPGGMAARLARQTAGDSSGGGPVSPLDGRSYGAKTLVALESVGLPVRDQEEEV